jgi:hypothetical protein
MTTTATFPRGSRIFVDECKARGYSNVATSAMPHDVLSLEKALRRLTRPGQRRVHFKQESDSSRRALLSALTDLGVQTVVYSVSGLGDKAARKMCLDALIDDAVRCGVKAGHP